MANGPDVEWNSWVEAGGVVGGILVAMGAALLRGIIKGGSPPELIATRSEFMELFSQEARENREMLGKLLSETQKAADATQQIVTVLERREVEERARLDADFRTAIRRLDEVERQKIAHRRAHPEEG